MYAPNSIERFSSGDPYQVCMRVEVIPEGGKVAKLKDKSG